MDTFTMKFQLGQGELEIGLIISPLDQTHRKFQVERITGEQNPVILTRSTNDKWLIENPGKWEISDRKFQELGKLIDAHLDKIDQIKNILVLTDFSEASFNAARFAAGLTQQVEVSSVILYHSYKFNPVAMNIRSQVTAGVVDVPQKSSELLENLKEKLEKLVDKKTKIELYTDDLPFIGGVKSIAEQQLVGLVVMGITGKSELEQILVGSNTTAMAKVCTIPLLIVPQKAKFEKIRRILFACDVKKFSISTPVDAIKTAVRKLDAKLLILNVGRFGGEQFEADTITGETLLHKKMDSMEPEYHYISHNDVAKGIMQFAGKHHIQLVITVPERYGFFESLFHRSLTKKLAFHTHIPLLLLKETI
jgi:nucleotide-binding universal stress UspA family protein